VGWEIVRVLTYYPPDQTFFLFSKDNIHEYDIATDTWTTKNPSGDHQDSYNRQVPYDSVNNVFGMVNNGAFHYYSPVTNTWYQHPYDTTLYPRNPSFEHTIYDPVDNVYIVVIPDGYHGWETWAYKLSDTPGAFPGTGTTVENASRHNPVLAMTASPNPFNAGTVISVNGKLQVTSCKLSIFDIRGKNLRTWNLELETERNVTWNASGLPAGLYLVRARVGNRTLEKKITLLK
jgi:hypothetical protein